MYKAFLNPENLIIIVINNFKFKLGSSEATTSTISYISLICHFCKAHLLNVINIIFDFGSIFTKAFSSAEQ